MNKVHFQRISIVINKAISYTVRSYGSLSVKIIQQQECNHTDIILTASLH